MSNNRLKELLEREPWVYEFLAEKYQKEKELAVAAVGNGDVYELLPEALKGDKDVLIAAIEYSGDVLDEMEEDMFRDMDVVRAIVDTYPYDYEQLPEDMQRDKNVALECLKVRGNVYECFCDELREDPEIIETAIRNGLDLAELNPGRWSGDMVKGSEELLKREDLVRIAIEYRGGNELGYAAPELWEKEELRELALSTGFSEIGKLPEHLRGDRSVVLRAVKNMVPERFDHDVPQIVSMAKELKCDETFLLELVAEREEIFRIIIRCAKNEVLKEAFPLKSVEEFCKKAYQVNKKTLKYMNKDMKKAVKE